MLNQTTFFGLLGALLVVAFCANRLAHRTQVPDLIILMLTGLALGPLSGLIDAARFELFTHYLGTLAIILILFEAGTELNLRENLHHFPAGVLLALCGYGLSFAAATSVASLYLRLPLKPSLLVGAVFGCTSSTMVLPVLEQFDIRGPAKVVLLLEAALGDVLAVITVGSLVDIAEGDPLLAGLVGGLVTRTAISIVLAAIAGLAWPHVVSRLPQQRFTGVLNVAVTLVLFSCVRLANGSGLLAVLAFGLTLANGRSVWWEFAKQQGVAVFHSELSFLVRSFFFVLLGASVQFVAGPYVLATVLVLCGLVLTRLVAVRVVGSVLRAVGPRERRVLLCIFPRGLITAVLALQVVAAEGRTLEFLPAMAFTVILATNLLVVFGVFTLRVREAPKNEVHP